MSFIKKVGFELEGGWAGELGVSPFKDLSLIHDLSVNGQTLQDAPLKAVHVGEAVSPPLPFAEVERWEEWLLTHWPNAEPPNRTNNTCAFHIHISFDSLKAYTLLTSKLFLFELREVILAKGKEEAIPSKHSFWKRVNGGNTFCHLEFSAPKQMKVADKATIHRARYGWLNFATALHGTVEFRALPTFRDATLGVKFAKTYFDFVEAYLAGSAATPLYLEGSF